MLNQKLLNIDHATSQQVDDYIIAITLSRSFLLWEQWIFKTYEFNKEGSMFGEQDVTL